MAKVENPAKIVRLKLQFRTLLIVLFSMLTFLLACSLPVDAQESLHPLPQNRPLIAPGTGRFRFTDEKGNVAKPFTVWTYLDPNTSLRTAPILIVMHGTLRNGETYRDAWIEQAKKYHFLLLVPEFSSDLYPSYWYNRGGILAADDKTPQPESQWSFTAIEHLFDFVRAQTGNTSPHYDLYGHSAGGQFVHRLALFLPNARYRRAIAANSGYYTLPLVSEDTYPFSFAGTPVATEASKKRTHIFQRELMILLGTGDTDPNDPDLYHSPEADKQGLYRLARGENFFHVAQAEAKRLHTRLRWQLKTVPGVAHDNAEMAPAAAALLYDQR